MGSKKPIMSVIDNNIRDVDTNLDRLKQHVENLHLDTRGLAEQYGQNSLFAFQTNRLGSTIDSLSVTSKSNPVLRADRIAALISAIPQVALEPDDPSNALSAHTTDLLWLLAAKAVVQTSGAVLKILLQQITELNNEIDYWDAILGSRSNIVVYTLQTLPVRLWHKTSEAFTKRTNEGTADLPASTARGWMQSYSSIVGVLRPLWPYPPKAMVLLPLLASRSEICRKRDSLKETKDSNAFSVGVLMKECILPYAMYEHKGQSCGRGHTLWCDEVSRSVTLMTALLEKAQAKKDPERRRDLIAAIDESRSPTQSHDEDRHVCPPPTIVIERLKHIHEELLPHHITLSARTIATSGRPSRIMRYWLPVSIAIFSTSTLCKFLATRRREIIGWIVDIGSTSLQFWSNWVVHPVQRLIRTIRHDENSEIALMSRNSLEADRASLERMVVDFITDQKISQNEEPSTNTYAIAETVREGDLTPVLRAYEKDLRKPFIGTIKGDLVRALLIQIQKTKVDVEIAIGGIDSLLKSQELVFGFVGLTPGIMVSYACLQWIYRVVSSKQGLKVGRKDDFRHAMRNAHRTAASSMAAVGISAYRDYGLLICDAEILLQKAKLIIKGPDIQAFQADIDDLVDQDKSGRKLDVIARMRWMYSKWLL